MPSRKHWIGTEAKGMLTSMPLAGGSSGKVGVHYEDKWTALCALSVLRERAQYIHIEPPGKEGDGIEFILKRADSIEYHQCKRQRQSGEWSTTALKTEGILKHFKARLSTASAKCVFISMQSASVFRELTEYARTANSHIDFAKNYLQNKDRRRDYEVLRKAWQLDEQNTLEYLRRIQVHTIVEEDLESWVCAEAELLLEGGDPAALSLHIVRVLQGSINKVLHADELWILLEQRSVAPASWRNSTALAVQIAAANKRYIDTRQDSLIAGQLIERDESLRLAELTKTKSRIMVCGDAGTGKSDVLLHLAKALDSESTPYLIFRLDRLTPSNHPDQLAASIGLPKSPVVALAALAADRRSVLIIDQLDIVSTTSGRHPHFFECVAEMVRQISSIPNMCLVMACRTFDLDNDSRLRRLTKQSNGSERIEVGTLSPQQVRVVLDSVGLANFRPSAAQLELLRKPIHLALLCESVEVNPIFTNSNDIFERFWKHKLQEAGQRNVNSTIWNSIIEALVDHMSSSQSLTAPSSVISKWPIETDVLISSHIIRRDGQLLAFIHESLFDYAFARCASARGQTLRHLLATDQLLFRRAQARQMLSLSRECNVDLFRTEVGILLTDSSVRFHLKEMLMSWLPRTIPDSGVLALIAPILFDPSSALFNHAWGLLANEAWFRSADDSGHIETALGSHGRVAERASVAVRIAATHSSDRVATLMRPFLSIKGWERRIASVFEQSSVRFTDSLFALCKDFIIHEARTHGRDGSARFALICAVTQLAHCSPAQAALLFGEYLRCAWEQAKEREVFDVFDYNKGTIDSELHLHEPLLAIAENAYDEFMTHVATVLFEIANAALTERYKDELWSDPIWGGRYSTEYYGRTGQIAESLFIATEVALRACARQDANRFLSLLALHGKGTSETIAYLFSQGFGANVECLADNAITYLIEDTRRFSIKVSFEPHWASRNLLSAVTPAASRRSMEMIEAVLLSYYPRCDHFGPRYGWTQYCLLTAIDVSRRSPSVLKRIGELSRKFGERAIRQPLPLAFHRVESPIRGDSHSKMSDSQWRSAIRKYTATIDQLVSRNDISISYKSGADELAHSLESITRESPARFAKLALSLPDDACTAYFDAILRGVAAATEPISAELTESLVTRCHRIPTRPCGRWIDGPIRRLAANVLPDTLYEVITWYATQDSDPVAQPTQDEERTTDILHLGLNSVRGTIASCIAALVAERPDHYSNLKNAVLSLVTDRVPAVRAMAAEILLVFPSQERCEAERLFSLLLENAGDELLASSYVQNFIWYYGHTNIELHKPFIWKMLNSKVASVRECGARNAVGIALIETSEEPLALYCCNSDDPVIRGGAAQVYATNLVAARFRETCEDALHFFFNDLDSSVRLIASNAIWRLTADEIFSHTRLCEHFISSAAFSENPSQLIHPLKSSTSRVPSLLLQACTAIFSRFGDGRPKFPYAYRDAFSLVVRAYTDSQTRDDKERALDLIDSALSSDQYGLAQELNVHDRGWL